MKLYYIFQVFVLGNWYCLSLYISHKTKINICCLCFSENSFIFFIIYIYIKKKLVVITWFNYSSEMVEQEWWWKKNCIGSWNDFGCEGASCNNVLLN